MRSCIKPGIERAVLRPACCCLSLGLLALAFGCSNNPHSVDHAEVSGKVLFRGKVQDVERRATEGFLRGRTRFDGMDDWKGVQLEIAFQNEWIVAWLDGKPIAMSPDLICVLDSVAGEAVGTETLRYGQRVTVIALPPPPVFLTPKGIQHVGPRAFGYDIEFKSVFA